MSYREPIALQSPIISCAHAFFTRHGGVSSEPFGTLNFGGTEDDPENVRINRERALKSIGLNPENVARMNQVHGTDVLTARKGTQTCDALVTSEKGLTLAVGAADCYPLLFHDPVNGIIGAAHAGWKGTLGRIAENTINKMVDAGADKREIRVAIGPGICRNNYEVSNEVIDLFTNKGFPSHIHSERQLDLLAANKFTLLSCGIHEDHIWAMNRCTTENDFFSYRRDSGKTGRMWAVICR